MYPKPLTFYLPDSPPLLPIELSFSLPSASSWFTVTYLFVYTVAPNFDQTFTLRYRGFEGAMTSNDNCSNPNTILASVVTKISAQLITCGTHLDFSCLVNRFWNPIPIFRLGRNNILLYYTPVHELQMILLEDKFVIRSDLSLLMTRSAYVGLPFKSVVTLL